MLGLIANTKAFVYMDEDMVERSSLEYSAVVWNLRLKNLDKLERIQRAATRYELRRWATEIRIFYFRKKKEKWEGHDSAVQHC